MSGSSSKKQRQLQRIASEQIAALNLIQRHPLWMYGNCGIRFANNNWAYSIRVSYGIEPGFIWATTVQHGKSAFEELVRESILRKTGKSTATISPLQDALLAKAEDLLTALHILWALPLLKIFSEVLDPIFTHQLAIALLSEGEDWGSVESTHIEEILSILQATKPDTASLIECSIRLRQRSESSKDYDDRFRSHIARMKKTLRNDEITMYRGFLISPTDSIRRSRITRSGGDFYRQQAGSAPFFTILPDVAQWFCWRKLFAVPGINENCFNAYVSKAKESFGVHSCAQSFRVKAIRDRLDECGLYPVFAKYTASASDVASSIVHKGEQEVIVHPVHAKLISYTFLTPEQIESSLMAFHTSIKIH